MIGVPADPLASMARDVGWALDALRAGMPEYAERILAHAWETHVLVRDGEIIRLDERRKSV